jgi:hypothetical protein
MKLIRALIKEVLQSHSIEPKVGDFVLNVNPGCKHYHSLGVVHGVEDLPSDKGRIVVYITTNSGASWKTGDVLEKTMDQVKIVTQD